MIKNKSMVNKILVYGTLQKGFSNEIALYLHRHSDFIGNGYFCGKLYPIDYYPGAIESIDIKDRVFGQLFQLHDEERALEVLDAYEEYGPSFPVPNEYLRKLIDVELTDGQKFDAWVYLYNHDVSRFKQIEDGDFMKYIEKQN
jgi:gamma-glutamylcyclotransferase (GGCT)/AIG2-like uncharacterized protein YtfP